MPVVAMERFLLRRNAQAFINAQPLDIQLNRPVKETTETGGIVRAGDETLEVQRFRWIPFKRRLTWEKIFSPQGIGREQLNKVQYILEGSHNADIREGDWFHITPEDHGLQSGQYEVVFVSSWREERTQAGLMYRGELSG